MIVEFKHATYRSLERACRVNVHLNVQGMPLYQAPGWVYSPAWRVAPTDSTIRSTHSPTYGSEGKPQPVFRSQVRVKRVDMSGYVRWWPGNVCWTRLRDSGVGPTAAFEIRAWWNFPHLVMLSMDGDECLSSWRQRPERQERWGALTIGTGVATGAYFQQNNT